MRGGEGFILVYSITEKRSQDELYRFKEMIDRVRNYEPVPIVIAGNKSDLGQRCVCVCVGVGVGVGGCGCGCGCGCGGGGGVMDLLLGLYSFHWYVCIGYSLCMLHILRRQVSTREGEAMAKEFDCPFFETSAALRHNVDEVFSEIVRCIRRKETNDYFAQMKKDGKGKRSSRGRLARALCCLSGEP